MAKAVLTRSSKRDRNRFSPASTARSLPLREGNSVWVRLSLARDARSTAKWTLAIPLPYLDYAALYQPDGHGAWTRQVAGDTLAVDSWSRPAL